MIGLHANEIDPKWGWEELHQAALTRENKWDLRYLEVAKLVGSWSKDPSTQAGAVIVSPQNRLVSVGYNGFPSGMLDKPELYADREEKSHRVVHCEMNALISAGREVRGCTLYTYPFGCCERCIVHMLQAGISRFVYPALDSSRKERWGHILERSFSYAREYETHPELVEISRKELGLEE